MPVSATVSVEPVPEPLVARSGGAAEPSTLRPLTEQSLLAALATLTGASG